MTFKTQEALLMIFTTLSIAISNLFKKIQNKLKFVKNNIYQSRIAVKLYSFIYKKWLWNDYTGKYDKVTEILNWRRARIKTKSGMVSTISPCFKILGIEFK